MGVDKIGLTKEKLKECNVETTEIERICSL